MTSPNTSGSSPVQWLPDVTGASAILNIGPSVTSISQAINVSANGGFTAIHTAGSGLVTFTGNITLLDNQPNVTERQTLVIDAVGSATFTGVISEASPSTSTAPDSLSLSINTNDPGTVTLSGANTYTGGTTLGYGTLLVNNTTGSATGTGSVDIQSGATLGGNGIISPAANNNVTIEPGAFLSVGMPGHTSGQALQINLQAGGAFTISPQFTPISGPVVPAGTLQLSIFSDQSGTTLTEADRLIFTNTGATTINITGATLSVHDASGTSSSWAVGDAWKLIDWGNIATTGTLTGTFNNLTGHYSTDFTDLPALGSGFQWDISQLYTTGIITVAVPEPTRLLLLIFSLFALGWRRRRFAQRL